ncbi:MAG: AMP-binding protein [Thermodesulfobacteriota bacterium]
MKREMSPKVRPPRTGDHMAFDRTLIGLILKNAREMPQAVAMREKRFGIWSPISWKEFRDQVECFALGLRGLGLRAGDRIAIIGDNKPQWIVAQFGGIAAGGVVTGMYADCLPEEMLYLLRYAEARFVVLRDQEQVDKLLKVWDSLEGQVSKVIVWDSRGMSHYYPQHGFLLRFEEILQIGRKELEGKAAALEEMESALDPQAPALMLTTSGTTAMPKLSMLSHRNLIFAAQSYGQMVEMRRGDELLSLAPLPWIGEQLYNVTRFLMVGARYNFPEETETVRRDLLELQPFYFGGTPATWELLISTIQAAMDNADFLKKNLYRKAMEVALRCTEAELAGQRVGPWQGILRGLMDFFVIRPLKSRVGLGRVRMAVTGGGAISPEVFRYFKALGIDMRQVYGQSECSGIATTHRADDVRPETVGVPIPGVEVRISPEGEIEVRGPNVHLGYYRNDQATREGFTEDGFWRTGDAGYLGNDGHLYVFDRFKDLMVLQSGTRFAPQDIETRLKFSPYIKEAVVFGADRPFVAAIVSVDLENVGNWAKRRGIPYTTLQDLSQRPETYQLVREEIRKLCERFPEEIRVRRFAILLKELHPDDGELTRTRKVRRAFVNERYRALIEDLYSGASVHPLDIQIRYEDGRVSSFKGDLHIEEV